MTTRRLAAPAPGWTVDTDVVVVGSGLAGLSVAVQASRAGRVLLVTKTRLGAGSTWWAQGGIAAAVGPGDSPDQHLADTLAAGAGLCDPAAVAVLAGEGPARLAELAALGARFDRAPDGGLALTREGGHHRDRVVHAGGDATGVEVSRALQAALADAGVRVIEHGFVLDLLRGRDGRAAGVTLHVLGEGSRDGVGAVLARAVVLATGGLGRVFATTTNPAVSTGDGLALGLRAGAEVADCEFVQFHPTALWRAGRAGGRQPLVSEAMRGEGARLVDAAGRPVMDGAHPAGDLAPRDVVTRRMSRVMAEQGVDHLYLDARGLGADRLRRRFPTILALCRAAGVDPAAEPIPVAPAAHYASGGLCTDLAGRTSVAGLYACGEVACTGVHGANRLASNSLLEGLVFARRIADALADGLPGRTAPADDPVDTPLIHPATGPDTARAMTDGAGVLRSAASLDAAGKAWRAAAESPPAGPGVAAWEATNMHTVAGVLLAAAGRRAETRGCHWREEFPGPDPRWRGRLVTRLTDTGEPVSRFVPLPA